MSGFPAGFLLASYHGVPEIQTDLRANAIVYHVPDTRFGPLTFTSLNKTTVTLMRIFIFLSLSSKPKRKGVKCRPVRDLLYRELDRA